MNDGQAEVRRWFGLADRLVGRLRTLAAWREQGHLPGTIAAAAAELTDDRRQEALFRALAAARREVARGLESQAAAACDDVAILREGFAAFRDRFELSHLAAGGPFSVAGREFLFAFGALEVATYDLRRWAVAWAREWCDLADRPALGPGGRERFYTARDSCPWSDEIEGGLQRRLMAERSVMLRDAVVADSAPVVEAAKSGGRRGRMNREEATARRAQLLAIVAEQPTLRSDTAMLASMVRVNPKTVVRWLAELEQKANRRR